MKKIIILCAAILLLSGYQTQTNQNSSTQNSSSIDNGGWIDANGGSSSIESSTSGSSETQDSSYVGSGSQDSTSSSTTQSNSSVPSVKNPDSNNTKLDLSGFQKNMNVNSPLRLPTACKTEKGYYLQNEGLLYFFDNALGKMIVVCGNPECPHNDVDCNAWINSKLLSYYNGKLVLH